MGRFGIPRSTKQNQTLVPCAMGRQPIIRYSSELAAPLAAEQRALGSFSASFPRKHGSGEQWEEISHHFEDSQKRLRMFLVFDTEIQLTAPPPRKIVRLQQIILLIARWDYYLNNDDDNNNYNN